MKTSILLCLSLMLSGCSAIVTPTQTISVIDGVYSAKVTDGTLVKIKDPSGAEIEIDRKGPPSPIASIATVYVAATADRLARGDGD